MEQETRERPWGSDSLRAPPASVSPLSAGDWTRLGDSRPDTCLQRLPGLPFTRRERFLKGRQGPVPPGPLTCCRASRTCAPGGRPSPLAAPPLGQALPVPSALFQGLVPRVQCFWKREAQAAWKHGPGCAAGEAVAPGVCPDHVQWLGSKDARTGRVPCARIGQFPM